MYKIVKLKNNITITKEFPFRHNEEYVFLGNVYDKYHGIYICLKNGKIYGAYHTDNFKKVKYNE
jgi:hypothetical protein